MNRDDIYAQIRISKGPTKQCTACNIAHPVEEFPIKSAARLQLHARCKQAQRAANQASYRANPDKQKAVAGARRDAIRAEFNAGLDAWLAGRACTICGEVKAHMLAVQADGVSLRGFDRNGFTADDLPALLAGATAECRSCRQPDPVWLHNGR